MGTALSVGIGDFEMFHAALREPARAVPFQFQFGFHPSDHNSFKLGAVGPDGARESLIIEQFEQRGKTLSVPVVRRGREKQLVLEVRYERANRRGAEGVGGILAAS